MTDQLQDSLLVRFLTEIGIIEQLVRSQMERDLPDGLKVSQFTVLNHLVRLGGDWSPVRLARAFQVTKGAMTNTVRRLEKRGLVRVAANPRDGRGKLVSLTEAGRDMRQECIACVEPALLELSRELTASELSATTEVLEKTRRYLDARRDTDEA